MRQGPPLNAMVRSMASSSHGVVSFNIETITTSFMTLALAFLPDGRIVVSERFGLLRIIE